jgi:hypothetical protein
MIIAEAGDASDSASSVLAPVEVDEGKTLQHNIYFTFNLKYTNIPASIHLDESAKHLICEYVRYLKSQIIPLTPNPM